jgi:hypothetical protein
MKGSRIKSDESNSSGMKKNEWIDFLYYKINIEFSR